MKRVMVIAYYFPPMGLSGVQRVAGFVRHLPACGWEPTVLTIEPAGYYAYDESLLEPLKEADTRIVPTRSVDPTRLFKRRSVVAMPAEPARRRLSRLSEWFFVPDNKVGWLPFALTAGKALLKERAFDAIFSSAPPYTAHVIGARLAKSTGLPLVVDFRDDWVGNPRHHYPTRLHKALHKRLERFVLRRSRAAVTINDHIRRALEKRHDGLAVKVVPHGHDAPSAPTTTERNDGKFQLLYTGVFYDAQTPDYFLRALRSFLSSHSEAEGRVEAVFAGLMPKASASLVRKLGLSGVVRHLGYLPHDETASLQRQADVLWMTIGTRPGSEGMSTGKLFEYIGQRKPILALVPEGAAMDTLRRYRAAVFAPPEDETAIENALTDLFTRWSVGTLPAPNEAFAQSLYRGAQARDLAQTLTSCIPE